MNTRPKKDCLSCVLVLTAFVALLPSEEARAEVVLGFYGGIAETFSCDVNLEQINGTDLKYKGVSWQGKSFELPLYFGFRLSYWIHGLRNLGIMVDFTHAKMYAELDTTVTVTGLRRGTFINRPERLGETFEELAFSHGHNLLTANILYRFFPKGERDKTIVGRMQPYLGLGFGVAFPHVEVAIDGTSTEEYQTTGPVAQVLGGLNFDIVKHLSLFLEYKLNYANMNIDLLDGGKLELGPWTNNFILGLAVYF